MRRAACSLLVFTLLLPAPARAARLDWFLQPLWDQASAFSEGLAAVRSGTLWGFIDPTGRWAVEPRYRDARSFHGGLAAVLPVPVGVQERWGFIDPKGQFVIPPRFAAAASFSEGLAAVRPDPDGRWGYADPKGALVIAPQFDLAGPFSQGYAAVTLGGTSFFIDRKGQPAFEGVFFDQAWPFAEDRAAVLLNGKVGFIDEAGRLAIAPAYQPAPSGRIFSEGLAGVSLYGMWGFIRLDGAWFIQPFCEAVKDFSGGLGAVRRGGAWGFVALSGKLAIPYVFDDVMPFSEGIASAALGGRWGYIDPQGAWMSDPVFLEAWPFSEGLGAARSARNGLWGYVGRNIAPLFDGLAFDRAGPFVNGFAPVERDGQRFYIDTQGRVAVPQHKGKGGVPGKRAGVVPWQAPSGLWGYKRETDGLILIPPFLEGAGEFQEGRAAVSLGKKWWYIPLPE